MFEDALSAAIRMVRGYTAVRAWAVEVLAVFVLFTVGRFGLAVWMFDMAASGAGAGYVPGWVPAAAAVGLVAGDAGVSAGAGAGGATWWVAWLYAYDNLRSYAENAIIAGMVLAFVFEGVVMFLARKRIRISKEEGHAAGREEVRAELQPQLEAAQAEIRELREQQARQDAENRELRERQAARDEEFRQLLERQATRDEEFRQFLEQLAQRQNGGSNAG